MVPIRSSAHEWERAYEAYLQGLALRCLRIAAPLVVFVFALDGVVERVFQPSLFWWSFWVRITASLLILALLVASYRQRTERFAFATVTVVLFVVAADVETVILPPRHGEPLQIRIGINTGPVVAGVIGRNKFAYDLWGDAVNTAARMESSGVPGLIQVTHAVYVGLRERYVLAERGTLSIKGKGDMTTYFLTGRRAEASR